MKKLAFLIVLLLNVCLSFGQVVSKDPPPDENEPKSWIDGVTYEEMKKRIVGRPQKKAPDVYKTIRSLEEMDEDNVDRKVIEEIILDMYTLPNSELFALTRMSRTENSGNPKDFDAMSKKYFEAITTTFNENALMVQLDKSKVERHNAVVRMAFSTFFETAIDYAECLLCCPKASFPDERWFWQKPKTGKSIIPYKAEYSAWYSNKLCGFMIYDFPCKFSKARFKMNLAGLMLWGLNGKPRFKQLAPNGDAVHVAMIPVILVLGLRDLRTPPCQNKELQQKLLSLVQVRCS